MLDFETFFLNKNDEIVNSAFELINAFIRKNTSDDIEWDMEIIGEVVDAVENVLTSHSLGVCYPFYCDDIPCYQGEGCGNAACPFRNER